jgi:hypothetical protein
MRKQVFFHPGAGCLTPPEFVAMFPGVSINAADELLADIGVERLVQTQAPACGEFQTVDEVEPVRGEDGRLHRAYVVREMFEHREGSGVTVEQQQQAHRAAILEQEKARALSVLARNRADALAAPVSVEVPGYGLQQFSMEPLDVALRTTLWSCSPDQPQPLCEMFVASGVITVSGPDAYLIMCRISGCIAVVERQAAFLRSIIMNAASTQDIPTDLGLSA